MSWRLALKALAEAGGRATVTQVQTRMRSDSDARGALRDAAEYGFVTKPGRHGHKQEMPVELTGLGRAWLEGRAKRVVQWMEVSA